MDWNTVWEWLRPMIGFFMAGVFLLLIVYLFVRSRKKKGPSSPMED